MAVAQPHPYTPFSIDIVPNRREVVVALAGELDLATADQVEEAVAELLATGFEVVVVDLRKVDFIDSTGLRMLLALRDAAKRRGEHLTLVAPAAAATRIFELTSTRDLFDWRERPASRAL